MSDFDFTFYLQVNDMDIDGELITCYLASGGIGDKMGHTYQSNWCSNFDTAKKTVVDEVVERTGNQKLADAIAADLQAKYEN